MIVVAAAGAGGAAGAASGAGLSQDEFLEIVRSFVPRCFPGETRCAKVEQSRAFSDTRVVFFPLFLFVAGRRVVARHNEWPPPPLLLLSSPLMPTASRNVSLFWSTTIIIACNHDVPVSAAAPNYIGLLVILNASRQQALRTFVLRHGLDRLSQYTGTNERATTTNR
jgi:hypothetical protein